MKEGRKRTIFSNYYSDEMFESARENLIENHFDEADCKLTDDEVWEQYSLDLEDLFEYEKENLKDIFDNGLFILQGDIGTWHGTCKGGFVFSGIDGIYKAIENCDYFELYDVNGHFYIRASHHDGTNFYEIKELNDRGREYYDRHMYMDPRELHNKLMRTNYSRVVNYANKVYGCPKRQYIKGGK